MKYIFVAGAPGSKWSSVVKNIYYSASVDRSDYRDHWTYYHDASGKQELMHLGAYFDPGMELNLPENLKDWTRDELEAVFDAPFDKHSTGVRIIKSHIFSYKENLEYLKQHWPDCPRVLVYRGDDSCLGWWVKCGHFDITYPSYTKYYKDLKHMAQIIKQQNDGIRYWGMAATQGPINNIELAEMLGITAPPAEYLQTYPLADVKVAII